GGGVLAGRVQHRGARHRAPLAALLASRLRSRPREPGCRPGGRRSGDGYGQAMDVTLTVETPARLDAFVHAALAGASRRLVHRLIADGTVRVNDRSARKGTRLRAGDRVTLPALPASVAPEPALALPVVHEDAQLVVI